MSYSTIFTLFKADIQVVFFEKIFDREERMHKSDNIM